MKCLFCFLIFWSGLNAYAQTAKDTTINGRPFVLHLVQPQETLYGIAREYNAELNQVVVQNPSVIQGLKVGMKILVPLQKPRVDEEKEGSKIFNVFKKKTNTTNLKQTVVVSDSSIVKAALLLPFYLDMNDTLEAHNETDIPSAIYSKSQIAIEYYLGAQLAFDTLSSLGYQLDIQVLDVSNDSVFEDLLTSGLLEGRQLIIGPLHIRQFDRLSERFGRDFDKVLVSPLSYKNAITHFPNTYQATPLSKTQLDTIIGMIKAKHAEDHLVIIGQEDESNILKYTKVGLLASPNQVRFKQYILAPGDFPDKEKLYDVLDEKKNIVLIPSNNRSFVSRLLPMLGSMEDTSFTVYGLDSWNRFDNLDMNDLVKLNLHIPSVLFAYPKDVYHDFVFQFYEKNSAYPSKYAFAAYKQVLFFVSKSFSDFYHFENPRLYEGQLNTIFPIIHYKDYKQHLVK